MLIHGSSVALAGRAVLITGASGRGKSTLALALMAVGGELVSDDQVMLSRDGDLLLADAPATIRGRIEARGVGILTAAAVGPMPVALCVDLDRSEDHRLPPLRHSAFLGVSVPLVLGPFGSHLCHAVRQYLIGGRAA